MAKQLIHPQEIEVYYLIPTLRRYFADFMKQRGMKQNRIASILGITPATISQYNSNKRGHKVDFEDFALSEIEKSAALVTDRVSYLRETQKLLRMIKESCSMCQIHKQFSDVPADCKPVAVGCQTW